MAAEEFCSETSTPQAKMRFLTLKKKKNLRTTSMKQSSSLLGGGINIFKHEADEKDRHLEKDGGDRKVDFSFSRQLLFLSPFCDWVYPLSEPWEKFTKQN